MDRLGTDLRVHELCESRLVAWWHDIGFGGRLVCSALSELLCPPGRGLAECVQEAETDAGRHLECCWNCRGIVDMLAESKSDA